MKSLEIILPLRNPPEVIAQSIDSIRAQTDRNFSVLLSDNHSTQGENLIADAVNQFAASGIAVRRVKPAYELGRVEHWNWAHHESRADWVKPQFAGDWLEPDYVARLRAGVRENPECKYVFATYVLHLGDNPPRNVQSIWAGKFIRAAQMEKNVLRYGMQFGPPSAAAYERAILIEIGGYPTSLPISSDSLLFCAMASRYGALGLAEPLCHFNIHAARFSTGLPQQRLATFREAMTYYSILGYHAWAQRLRFSKMAFARILIREARNHLLPRKA